MITIIKLIVAILCVATSSEVNAEQKACNTKTFDLMPCSESELCIETNSSLSMGFCDCRPGFKRNEDELCINATLIPNAKKSIPKTSSLVDEDKANGHIAVGILLPIFLISLVICGVYLSRKYSLMMYIRNKLHQRRNNYNEVMIGQDLDDDDPPLNC